MFNGLLNACSTEDTVLRITSGFYQRKLARDLNSLNLIYQQGSQKKHQYTDMSSSIPAIQWQWKLSYCTSFLFVCFIHYRLKLNFLSEDLIVNVLCAITRGASANNVKQINKKLEFNFFATFFLATAALSQWLQVILFFRRYITMCKSVEWILLALFPLLNVAVFFRPPRKAKTMFLLKKRCYFGCRNWQSQWRKKLKIQCCNYKKSQQRIW